MYSYQASRPVFSALERLPVDVKRLILLSLDNVASLNVLLVASREFNAVAKLMPKQLRQAYDDDIQNRRGPFPAYAIWGHHDHKGTRDRRRCTLRYDFFCGLAPHVERAYWQALSDWDSDSVIFPARSRGSERRCRVPGTGLELSCTEYIEHRVLCATGEDIRAMNFSHPRSGKSNYLGHSRPVDLLEGRYSRGSLLPGDYEKWQILGSEKHVEILSHAIEEFRKVIDVSVRARHLAKDLTPEEAYNYLFHNGKTYEHSKHWKRQIRRPAFRPPHLADAIITELRSNASRGYKSASDKIEDRTMELGITCEFCNHIRVFRCGTHLMRMYSRGRYLSTSETALEGNITQNV